MVHDEDPQHRQGMGTTSQVRALVTFSAHLLRDFVTPLPHFRDAGAPSWAHLPRAGGDADGPGKDVGEGDNPVEKAIQVVTAVVVLALGIGTGLAATASAARSAERQGFETAQ